MKTPTKFIRTHVNLSQEIKGIVARGSQDKGKRTHSNINKIYLQVITQRNGLQTGLQYFILYFKGDAREHIT